MSKEVKLIKEAIEHVLSGTVLPASWSKESVTMLENLIDTDFTLVKSRDEGRVLLTKEEQSALRVFRETHKPNAVQVYTFNVHDKRIVPTILKNMGFEKFFTAFHVGYDVKSDG